MWKTSYKLLVLGLLHRYRDAAEMMVVEGGDVSAVGGG